MSADTLSRVVAIRAMLPYVDAVPMLAAAITRDNNARATMPRRAAATIFLQHACRDG